MELLMVLVIFAAGWTRYQSFPIQDTYQDTNGNSPIVTNDTKTIFELIEDVNEGISMPLRGGDIAYPFARSAINCDGCIWDISPNGMVYVPYIISKKFTDSDISVITSAMKEFEAMTCVKFVSRTSERDHISIETERGCWSDIGKFGGRQSVNLDRSGCIFYGVIQHELMHSLGFFHEHARSDRDNHIKLIWQYIKTEAKGNFDIEDTNNLGLPYDYSSVMHYQKSSFTNTPGQATIIPIPDPTAPIGQRIGMSHLDIMKINKLYQCNLCRFKLSDNSGSFSTDDILPGLNGDNCLWLIQVPKKVYLQLSDIHVPSSNGCNDNYIKIYDGTNTLAPVLLNNTCGNVTLPPIISSGNQILLEFGSTQLKTTKTPKWNATYTTVSYGATFSKDNGVLLSPQYPKMYPNNVDGLWTIIAPVGSKVHLCFSSFILQPSSPCSNDYVTIIDGAMLTGPVLGTYCGSDTPPALVSSGNVMMVQFHTDSHVTYNGFAASYWFVNSN
ncbi:astacin-like metalloendopeptidase [Pelobates cultripes]|uniref:Metalloendopeptidase n=1 Tax=Pelobates cultripes TaxID=61616 RepID=A0AAD1R985_PELCU|nr:astacin-like metalloendopeptidase [Pelobates cultripes]